MLGCHLLLYSHLPWECDEAHRESAAAGRHDDADAPSNRRHMQGGQSSELKKVGYRSAYLLFTGWLIRDLSDSETYRSLSLDSLWIWGTNCADPA